MKLSSSSISNLLRESPKASQLILNLKRVMRKRKKKVPAVREVPMMQKKMRRMMLGGKSSRKSENRRQRLRLRRKLWRGTCTVP